MVEKSSLAPAKISDPGSESSLGATSASGGKITPEQLEEALVLRRRGGGPRHLAGGTALGANAGGYAEIGG